MLLALHVVFFYVLNSAANKPGVVQVCVYAESGQFLGETEFEYEDMMDTVVCQAVKDGSEGVSKLFELMKKHSIDMWKQSSSVMQNSGKYHNEKNTEHVSDVLYLHLTSDILNLLLQGKYKKGLSCQESFLVF